MSHSTAALLAAFQSYMEKETMRFADFEPLRQPEQAVADLFKKPFPADALQAIGKRRDGSLAALWRYAAPRPEQIVVWISSDGMPTGVVAASLQEFLGLLCYSTYCITDVLWTALQHWRKPDHYRPVTEKFAAGAERAYLKANRSRGAGYAAYIRWLRQAAGQELPAAPIDQLTNAFDRYPSFSNWYQQFN